MSGKFTQLVGTVTTQDGDGDYLITKSNLAMLLQHAFTTGLRLGMGITGGDDPDPGETQTTEEGEASGLDAPQMTVVQMKNFTRKAA